MRELTLSEQATLRAGYLAKYANKLRDLGGQEVRAGACDIDSQLFTALAAELKRALDENAKLRDRLAKCEPVIEIVRALQLTPIWASEIDPIDRLRKCKLPEVTP